MTHDKDCMMLSTAKDPHCTCGAEIKELKDCVKTLLANLKEIVSDYNDLGIGQWWWDEEVDKYVWRE